MDNETKPSPQEEIRNEKPLNELLTSQMVSIYTGQGNTQWYLHERLLCYYSPFFASIFYADDKNASQDVKSARRNRAYGIPDEEDLSFEMLVGWLYSRSLKRPSVEAEVAPLLDLYLLSERLEMEKLSSEIVDAVSEWYFSSQSYPGLRRVQYIYANTEKGSAMRDMMVGAVAKQLTTTEKIPDHWASALGRNGELAVDIIRAIQAWHIGEDTIPDARDASSSRGRKGKNGFSAIGRDGVSQETTLTEKTADTEASNLGVESIKSDEENDAEKKGEDSEAAGPFPRNLASQHKQSVLDQDAKRPPDDILSSMTLGSDDSTLDETAGEKTPTNESTGAQSKPRRSSLLDAEGLRIHGKEKRRLSVTFADQVYQFSYHHFPPTHPVATIQQAGKAQGKDADVPGSINSSPTLVDDASDQEAEGELIVAEKIIDVDLNALSHEKRMLQKDQAVAIAEERPQLRQSKSEPTMQAHTSTLTKQKSLASRPDVLMLSIMWLAYFGYLAGYSVT